MLVESTASTVIEAGTARLVSASIDEVTDENDPYDVSLIAVIVRVYVVPDCRRGTAKDGPPPLNVDTVVPF
jgi:hypothetical protein